MLMLLAAAVSVDADEASARFARMTALYEQACLHTFPDDKAVAALMAARNAKELSPEDVKITMGDDPARGWDLNDGGASLWIEFPPYHACSVRWNTPQGNFPSDYRAIANKYEAATGGYRPIQPYDNDQGDIHIHAVGEQRALPDKRAESLFIFVQTLNDSKRIAAGETGAVIRFVHQFAPPENGQ